jgi:hypothetical protein
MNDQNTTRLIRHFGTLQATALNMSNMIGIGPFLTIPLLMSALGGPQAMLGWLVALLIVIPDGTEALTGTEIVAPDAMHIVDQTPEPTATLFACHPKGSAAQRIVAHFRLVEG